MLMYRGVSMTEMPQTETTLDRDPPSPDRDPPPGQRPPSVDRQIPVKT